VSAYAQLKVVSSGDTEIKKVLYVGQDAGSNDAVVRIGQGRSASGNGLFTLTGDLAYPLWGLRFTRLSNGESRIEHRGNQPLFFNAPDLGGTYKFQIQGQTRVEFTGGAVKPGSAGITNNGTAATQWATVYANSYVTGSDRSLKKDIKELQYGLKEILELKPVSYRYRDKEALGTRIGLIAQDVEPIIGEIVMGYELTNETNSRGISSVSRKKAEVLSLNYIELIPILINAIKEQQSIIEEKELKLQELSNQVNEMQERLDQVFNLIEKINNDGVKVGTIKSQVEIKGNDLSSLSQNRPNPFNGQTIIDYEIPSNANSAQLNFYNPNGQLLKTVSIDHTGAGELTFKAADVPAGVYSYTLVVDGVQIGTKHMILN
jgi:hypothetical protein